jgi:hypothetical protein
MRANQFRTTLPDAMRASRRDAANLLDALEGRNFILRGTGVLCCAGRRETAAGKAAGETYARLHAHQPLREGRDKGPLLRAEPIVRATAARELYA